MCIDLAFTLLYLAFFSLLCVIIHDFNTTTSFQRYGVLNVKPIYNEWVELKLRSTDANWIQLLIYAYSRDGHFSTVLVMFVGARCSVNTK
jgi:hypothetical protein